MKLIKKQKPFIKFLRVIVKAFLKVQPKPGEGEREREREIESKRKIYSLIINGRVNG